MSKFIDILGCVFSNLTVLERMPNKDGCTIWRCLCDCGRTVDLRAGNLRSGNTTSCGCVSYKGSRNGNYRHGHAVGYCRTKELTAWKGLLSRCRNENSPSWPLYGGRGITVCVEWQHDFPSFYDHIGPAPSQSHSVDRIDNDRGYAPGNVRWATGSEQVRNSRKVINSMAGCCVVDMATKHGINRGTLMTRLRTGMSLDDALAKPVRKGNFRGRPRLLSSP